MTLLSFSRKTLESANVKHFTSTFKDISKTDTTVDGKALILSQVPQFWCFSNNTQL